MRIPYDLLTHLANALVNDTIFEIVKRLIEIQHVTESHLFELRRQAELEHEKEVDGWIAKIRDPEELQHILALMKIKHKKQSKETDEKIILHLDAKVLDQQVSSKYFRIFFEEFRKSLSSVENFSRSWRPWILCDGKPKRD